MKHNYSRMLDRELKKGSAELLILSLVETRARHGYEISKLIESRSGGALIGAGVGAGLLAAWASLRVLQSQFYELSAADPPTFAGVALLLAGASLLACYAPARRATKVSPLAALRSE